MKVPHFHEFQQSITQVVQLPSHAVFHYYREMNRYLNRLNFVWQKLTRSFNKPSQQRLNVLLTREFPLIVWYFWIYRIQNEQARKQELFSSLNMKYESVQKDLASIFQRVAEFNWEKALGSKSPEERDKIYYGIPGFFYNQLSRYHKHEEIVSFIRAMDEREIPKMNQDLSYTFYIGDFILRNPSSMNFPINPYAKCGKIGLAPKNAWFDFPALSLFHLTFNKFLPQSLASILIVLALDINEGDLVLDLCAAPGMKTRILAEESKQNARIIANDLSLSRFLENKELLENESSIHRLVSDGTHPPFRQDNKTKFDCILLDAPCSGSGTFSNHPELKWKQSHALLQSVVHLQANMLESAYSLLKTDGNMIYSTCSMYPAEGESQILNLMQNHLGEEEFQVINLPPAISSTPYISFFNNIYAGRFLPESLSPNDDKEKVRKNEGFFVCKIHKNLTYNNL